MGGETGKLPVPTTLNPSARICTNPAPNPTPTAKQIETNDTEKNLLFDVFEVLRRVKEGAGVEKRPQQISISTPGLETQA